MAVESGGQPLSQADIDALAAASPLSQADADAALAANAPPVFDPEEVAPSPAVFAPLDEPGALGGAEVQNLDIVMGIPLEVSVELGRKRMSIRDILDLGSGSIVELDKVAGEPVDLLVNGRLVARGEVVVIEDNFGVRITEIMGVVSLEDPANRKAE